MVKAWDIIWQEIHFISYDQNYISTFVHDWEMLLEWILDSGDTKDWKRAEGWILGKDFRNRLSGYDRFANLLVIHVSVHIDILKAKTVQNSEFRWVETAESRMARRYTHQNLSCPCNFRGRCLTACMAVNCQSVHVDKSSRAWTNPLKCVCIINVVSVKPSRQSVVTVHPLLHTVFTTHNSLAASTGNTFAD